MDPAPPSAALTRRTHTGGDLAVRLAGGLLVVVALVLPFEAPLFRVASLQITTVELALYALLAVWTLAAASGMFRDRSAVRVAVADVLREPMALAAVVWCLVELASAAGARSYRAASLKFALRTLSGVLVFFAARSLTRRLGLGRRVLAALVAGALLSAATAAIEAHVPASASILRVFREGDFVALGLTRASGVFGYPTIGAMYWEACLPLVMVLPFAETRGTVNARPTTRSTVLVLIAAALLIEALLASATRSGLAGAAVACAMLSALAWQRANGIRRIAGFVLGMLAASCMVAVASTGPGSLLGQRLKFWHDQDWFGVEYLVDTEPRTVRAGELFYAPVTLRNTGTIGWPSGGEHPTHLSYHWERLGEPTTAADYEGTRTKLPADVPPGGVLELLASVRGADAAGTYRLRWDVVQEEVTWFSDQGNAMPDQAVSVVPWPEGPSWTPPPGTAPPTIAPAPPSRPVLWRAAVRLWRERPLFGIGPDNFRRLSQTVLSAAPNGQPYTDTRLHANSLYFETLADLGVAGVLALALVMFALVRLLRVHAANGNLVGLSAGVGAATFFVHGAFDYFFEFTPILGLFWVLLGVTVAATTPSPSAAAPQGSRG